MESQRERHGRPAATRHHFVRRARLILVGILTLLIAFLPAPVTRALSDATWDFFSANGIYYYDPEGGSAECTTHTNGSNITIIGDSITEGSKDAILALLPEADIHSQVSKRFGSGSDEAMSSSNTDANPSGISIAKYLIAENQLQSTVVFALGSNNMPLTQAQIDDALALFGNNRQIFFITNYDASGKNSSYYDTNNSLFNTAAENSNVHVIDWAAAASADPAAYLSNDGLHPTAAGQELFAELISDAVGGSTSTTSGLNGNYTNYAGDQVLTDSQITLLQSNIPIYEQAIQNTGAGQHGINWQFMATLHYQETGLNRYNPDNGQGVYQMYTYVNETGNTFPPADEISEEEFLRQSELVITEELIPMITSNDLNLSNPDDIKRFFFSFNGRAQQYIDKALAMGFSQEEANNGEGSPYVMNKYDAARDPDSPDMDPNWPGRFVADGVYDPSSVGANYGAFTIYSAIGGADVCISSVSSGGLTLEQAQALMADYIYDVNCTDYDIYCTHSSAYGPKANCVTFVQYFIDRFTSATGIAATGNGGWVVSNLTGTDVSSPFGLYAASLDYSSKGFVYGGFVPKAFAIFSTGHGVSMCDGVKCGHTGVVLGINEAEDKIYIGQAGYDTPLAGYSDVIEYSLSDYTSGEYWFAYTDSIVDLNAISSAIGGI